MSLKVLIIVLGTLGMRIHNAKSVSMDASGTHYVVTEDDGSVNYLNTDRYMLVILR